MPPKMKFTRQQVIEAALGLVREDGMEALTARALADRLGASAKPIFGLFQSMEEVRLSVLAAADERYQTYLQQDMARGLHPPYKASGMAYIRFAREEGPLFRLLFMRDRSGEAIAEDRASIRPLLALIQQNLGLTEDEAYIFHIENWIYVHGIAVMIATGYLPWDEAFISRALTDQYQGLRHRFQEEHHGSQ